MGKGKSRATRLQHSLCFEMAGTALIVRRYEIWGEIPTQGTVGLKQPDKHCEVVCAPSCPSSLTHHSLATCTVFTQKEIPSVRSAIPAKSFAPKPKSIFKYPESLVTYI